MMRDDGRKPDQLRPVELIPNFVKYPEGSVLIAMGETRVLCNVSAQDGAPPWKQNQEIPGGWVTAEYNMLPRSTHTRKARETKGVSGRTKEISRLIGRSLRAAVDLEKLGERTFIVDCDVIQADGGTRTAAITGGYLALKLALQSFVEAGEVSPDVFLSPVAAISVGIVDGVPMLDLCYHEDVTAEADVNIVMNADGKFIEVQGTAEGAPFDRAALGTLLDFAWKGIQDLLLLKFPE